MSAPRLSRRSFLRAGPVVGLALAGAWRLLRGGGVAGGAGPVSWEGWSTPRWAARLSTEGRWRVISLADAPRKAVAPGFRKVHYMGVPVLQEGRAGRDGSVACEVKPDGLLEAGVVLRASYEDALALLAAPGEVLLCRYSNAGRRVLDRAPRPGAGRVELELVAEGEKIEATARAGGRAVRLSGRDPAPAAGRAGVLANPLDPDRPARARFASFRASLPQGDLRDEVLYAFAGGVVARREGVAARVTARTVAGGRVAFEISERADFSGARSTGPVGPTGRLRSVHAWLEGLEQGREYHWRPVVAGRPGPAHSLRTPPPPGGAVRFVFASCTSGRVPSFPSFARAAALRPHFYLHAGDWGYADQTSVQHSPDHFQARWIRLLRSPEVSALLRHTALCFWQDDHDYRADNGWAATVEPWAVEAFDELHANPAPEYFDMRWGDVHVWCLDCRLHASDPEAPDDASKTRLGKAQKAWLKEGMAASDAPVKVVASPMVFRNKVDDDPGWHNVYTTERDELLAFFASLPGVVVILSGDSHGQRLIHHYEFGELYEFNSSGTDFPPGWSQGNHDPEHTLLNYDSTNGFAVVELDPAGPGRRLTVRVVAAEDGRTLFGRSFEI